MLTEPPILTPQTKANVAKYAPEVMLGAAVGLAGGLALFISWPMALLLLAPNKPSPAVRDVWLPAWAFFGVTQFVYVAPICIWAWWRGLRAFSLALLGSAAIVVLFNLPLLAFLAMFWTTVS